MTTPPEPVAEAPAPPADDGILRIGETAGQPRWEVMFRIAGKEYEGLANPSGSVLIRYLDTQRKRGGNVAVSWLLERMLTPDAYQALMDNPALSDADVRQVTDLVTGLVLGTRGAAPKAAG